VDVELAVVDVCDIVVLKVEDFLGVLHERGSIRREEELGRLRHAVLGEESSRLRSVKQVLVWRSKHTAGGGAEHVCCVLLDGDVVGGTLGGQGVARFFTLRVFDIDKIHLHLLCRLDTHNEGRTLSSGDDFLRVVDRLQEEAEGALKLLDDRLGESGKVQVWVRVVEELGEFGNALGVRVGLELEALAFEERPELFVVGDDTVVDDCELPLGVRPVLCQLCFTLLCAVSLTCVDGSSSCLAVRGWPIECVRYRRGSRRPCSCRRPRCR